MSKQKSEFEESWQPILEVLGKSGAEAVVSYLQTETDPSRRANWYSFVISGLAFRDWPEKNLDTMIVIGRAAIADAQAQAQVDVDQADQWNDTANRHCFNLSANLADCWADGFERRKEHFERGLEWADRALAYRDMLAKPVDKKAMAMWARGKHLLSLGSFADAETAFAQALAWDQEAAGMNSDAQFKLTGDLSFTLLLDAGFLALAKWRNGDNAAEARLQDVMAIYESWLQNENKKGDAELGLLELRESIRLN